MAPPSKSASKPGRALAVLAVLLVAMLLAIVGPNLANPAGWGHDFRVGLGLDLTSGTQVTLKAVPPKGRKQPSSTAMKEAANIMLSRVNGSGTSGAQVQQEGGDLINVTVPGQGSEQVVKEVSTTAQLRFRPVLLVQPPATKPASTKALIRPAGHPAAPATLTDTRSGSSSASAAASPSASRPSSAATSGPAATSNVYGAPAQVTKGTRKLFDKLNCAKSNWKKEIGYTSRTYDDPNQQVVGCGTTGPTKGYKYVLGKAAVLGTQVSSAHAGVSSTSNGWVVDLTLNSKGTKAFGALTTHQYDTYYPSASSNADDFYLDEIAITLDGNVVAAPQTQGAIVSGNPQISNLGGQQPATQLADELKYGALPLTFTPKNVSSVSAQLGKSQLYAGLIAAAIGLALVVLYSVFYYRGLALVSVVSLATAGVTTFLAVVLLSAYQNFTLDLAGVAGLIVAIGITADSFVIFFERLRDEVREGRSLRAAVESGWKRARRTILVSDTVSFLAALLLYIFAIGKVQGFAYTLGLTTLIDVVVVFLFTKPMVTLLSKTDFYGRGKRGSGLEPARLGSTAPWRSGAVVRNVRRTSGRRGGAGTGRAGDGGTGNGGGGNDGARRQGVGSPSGTGPTSGERR